VRPARRDGLAGEAELEGHRERDALRERGAAAGREQAALDLGDADLGVLAGDDQVAGEG
jgi:hypothetical protein